MTRKSFTLLGSLSVLAATACLAWAQNQARKQAQNQSQNRTQNRSNRGDDNDRGDRGNWGDRGRGEVFRGNIGRSDRLWLQIAQIHRQIVAIETQGIDRGNVIDDGNTFGIQNQNRNQNQNQNQNQQNQNQQNQNQPNNQPNIQPQNQQGQIQPTNPPSIQPQNIQPESQIAQIQPPILQGINRNANNQQANNQQGQNNQQNANQTNANQQNANQQNNNQLAGQVRVDQFGNPITSGIVGGNTGQLWLQIGQLHQQIVALEVGPLDNVEPITDPIPNPIQNPITNPIPTPPGGKPDPPPGPIQNPPVPKPIQGGNANESGDANASQAVRPNVNRTEPQSDRSGARAARGNRSNAQVKRLWDRISALQQEILDIELNQLVGESLIDDDDVDAVDTTNTRRNVEKRPPVNIGTNPKPKDSTPKADGNQSSAPKAGGSKTGGNN